MSLLYFTCLSVGTANCLGMTCLKSIYFVNWNVCLRKAGADGCWVIVNIYLQDLERAVSFERMRKGNTNWIIFLPNTGNELVEIPVHLNNFKFLYKIHVELILLSSFLPPPPVLSISLNSFSCAFISYMHTRFYRSLKSRSHKRKKT